MSGFPLTLVAFIGVLGVLIVVHEFGHFLVARWCGVKVLRFSVGFGKPLWSRKLGRDGTEWVLALFQLGGYVKMLDEREGPVAPEERERAYNRKSVGKRSLIVAAGPFANFLFAFLLYWGIFSVGSEELLPILGNPAAGSPAAAAGVNNGDVVRKVDGETVDSWQDFRWLLLQKAVDQDTVELETVNDRQEIAYRKLSVAPVREQGWEGDGLERLGLTFYRPHIPAILGVVVSGGVADRAGLRSADEVVAIDGQPVANWQELVLKIRRSIDQTLILQIRRDGQLWQTEVRPEAANERGQTVGRIGVKVAESPGMQRGIRVVVRYDPLQAGVRALNETWDKSVFSLVMLGKMLTGEVSWRNLSGPVTIADYAGQSARMGADYYLKFMALLSVSLGVLNLLPIPVLDGGHLLYHMLEVIKRGPLSERVMEIGQQIGLSILLALMAFAFFNDIHRLLSG